MEICFEPQGCVMGDRPWDESAGILNLLGSLIAYIVDEWAISCQNGIHDRSSSRLR